MVNPFTYPPASEKALWTKGSLYGIGYTGEGVNLANLSGKIIADLYADNPGPWQDLPFVNRVPTRIPPEPLRYMALKSTFSLGRLLSR